MTSRSLVSSALALAALLSLSSALGCDKSKPSAAPAAAPTAPAPSAGTVQAKQLIAAGALVIDVREQGEWDEGHLPQARLMPVGTIDQRLADIEQAAGGKDKPIVLYCRTGGRSSRAKEVLTAAGFTNVVNGGSYRGLSTP